MAFEKIIGQDFAIGQLQTALDHKRLSHAYLFLGQSGTLKLEVAMALAREVLSSPAFNNNQDMDFQAYSKNLFDKGNHPDFHVIEPSSNQITIKQIRALKDELTQFAKVSKYSVVIIKEAHLLGLEASNAFLKTLEEPLGDILFILIASSQEKLLDTISSRVQTIYFNPLSKAVLLHYAKAHPLFNEKTDEKKALLLSLSFGSLEALYFNLAHEDEIIALKNDLFNLIKDLKSLHIGVILRYSERLNERVKTLYKTLSPNESERNFTRSYLKKALFLIESFIRDSLMINQNASLYHRDFKASYPLASSTALVQAEKALYKAHEALETNTDYFLVFSVLLIQLKTIMN